MTPDRILLAEDDAPTRDAVQRALTVEGYEVASVGDGVAALELVDCWQPDALVLDVMMPVLDGLAVCRRLRARGDRTPVLIVTAREALSDRVDGLDAGADDYLVKPFELEELLARLRALIRRAYPEANQELSYGPVTLDLSTREASFSTAASGSIPARCGSLLPTMIQLTKTEASLLEVFMLNPNQVLPRTLLEERIWGWDVSPGSNPLAVYVNYLRRKLEDDGRQRLIHTVRGIGYRFGRAA